MFTSMCQLRVVCVLVLTRVNNRSLHNRHHKDSALLFPELFSKKVSSYTFHTRQLLYIQYNENTSTVQ